MSAYEAERAAQIEKNRALIASLGIAAKPNNKRAVQEVSEDVKPPKPKRAKTSAREHVEPIRRSTRIVENASLKTEDLSQLPDDWDDARLSNAALRRGRLQDDKALRIRQLAAPEIPEPPAIDNEADFDPDYRAPPPSRDPSESNSGYGRLHFEDTPHFTPNLTPEEILRLGSFGGTYWRSFYSRVARKDQKEDLHEFPPEWYAGLDTATMLTSQNYNTDINQYKVKASQSIEEWETQGWIRAQDPRGWTQWYFRFYLGRRTADDDRQIRRMLSAVGPRGRFKTSLAKKIAQAGGAEMWDDPEIAPILRQTLQHWAVRITKEDILQYLSHA